MKTLNQKVLAAFMFPLLFAVLMLMTVNQSIAQTLKVKDVVLVHCAFADGSGWRALYDVLSKRAIMSPSFKTL